MTTSPPWAPVTEPWRTTAFRTVGLALAIGIGVGLIAHRLPLAPAIALFALWFTLGGHFVERLFLDRVRQRIAPDRSTQVLARIAVWFAGGALLYAGAAWTQTLLVPWLALPWPWWMVGVGFVGGELLIHLQLHARGQASFYDGNG